MIGTTRSRVSVFMNRFRKLGFINYNGRIQVKKSLLNVVLLDQLPGHNAQKPQLRLLEAILNPLAPMDRTIPEPAAEVAKIVKCEFSIK